MSGDAWLASDPTAAGPSWDGLFVSVAAKLWARTGSWPAWFVRVVGDPVPAAFVALALNHRRILEEELGVALPVAPAPPLAMVDARTPRPGAARARRAKSGESISSTGARR